MSKSEQTNGRQEANFCALFPFFVFLAFYLGVSIIARDFYRMPMPVAFIVASAVALLMNSRLSTGKKVDIYARAMGEENIMIMCLIFVLAGIFANVAKGMGAVDAAVVLARAAIPDQLLLAGMFLVSCFISLAIGTSCGTIAGLTPIAVGLVTQMDIPPALMLGCVVGGAMFGDNMSVISDTTIAATRTQGVAMRDKFLTNLKIALPAALIALVYYLCSGAAVAAVEKPAVAWRHVALVMPYALILVGALCSMNVMALLFLGTCVATAIGVLTGAFDLWRAFALMGEGTIGMSETMVVALLAGGLLGIIRHNGGIAFIIRKIEAAISAQRGCEFGIACLVAVINLFTANNTVAIVIAGPIAKEVSDKYSCDGRRIASIMDATSCVIQGVIPYGAQVLIAVGVAKTAGIAVSSGELLLRLHYPQLLAIALIAAMAIGPGRKSLKAAA